MRIRITGSGTAKPSEVLEALLGVREIPARLVRQALYCQMGDERVSPRDVVHLRRAPSAHAVV
jgi:hypothetical protein